MRVVKILLEKKVRWIITIVFMIITLLISWNSDDAYHAYIMAKNFAEGNGLVYNTGYRVTASTCPLFTILVGGVYALFGCRYMYFAGILLGVILSTLAMYVLVFGICNTDAEAVYASVIIMSCYCFMSYTTSGLENSLLFFLAAVFVFILFSKDNLSLVDLFILAILISLLAMTRMDSVVLFIVPVCYGFWFCSKEKFIYRVLMGILGLLPFFVWEIFSLIYYGYPFPNTMYVKLNTGFPKAEYISRGIDYIIRSSLVDIILIILPFIILILSIKRKKRRECTVALGCLLYIAYVVYIGGDFMVGRHLTLPFFVSVMGIIVLYRDNSASESYSSSFDRVVVVLICIQLIWSTCVRPVSKEYLYEENFGRARTGVADEKHWYYSRTGFIPYVVSMINGGSSMRYEAQSLEVYSEIIEMSKENKGCCTEFLPGIMNYYIQIDCDMYMTDKHGLMDPLLSHLPAHKEEGWRIGHMWRDIPEGYPESIETGTNRIENKELHEYYDKVLLIITGDIWDKERIKTIIDMNLGKYDYLIEEYCSSLNNT